MIIVDLAREYFEHYAIGRLSIDEVFLSHSLELPWRDNQVNVSCIPHGWYPLELKDSARFGLHLQVNEVPGRHGILFHPANDAVKELRGCIAPVLKLAGSGRGRYSRLALDLIISNLKMHDQKGVFLRVHEMIS